MESWMVMNYGLEGRSWQEALNIKLAKYIIKS